LDAFGIARAYDFGIDANTSAPFSTAERVNWASLDRRVAAQGPLDTAAVGRAIAVLARALDAAHAAGLVHRDLKPQNVFISPDNPEWVRITDFGISALRREVAQTPGFSGPPGYTPLEATDSSSPNTPGVDLFALGSLVFFALTGGTPFRSLAGGRFDPSAHRAELSQPAPSMAERAREFGVVLDSALDGWFARALAPDPAQRFASAGELSGEFTRITEGTVPRGGGPRTLPGIAAAIAQPLLFQPEPSAVSLGLSPAPPTASGAPRVSGAEPALAAAAPAASAVPGMPAQWVGQTSSPDFVAGLPRRRVPLAIWVGGGFALVGVLAVSGYALLNRQAGTSLAVSASATSSAAPPAPSATTAPAAAPSASAASAPAEPAPSVSASAPVPSTKPRAPVRSKTRSIPAKAVPKPKTGTAKTTTKKCSGCK
jgi:hypothetical protein